MTLLQKLTAIRDLLQEIATLTPQVQTLLSDLSSFLDTV